MTPKHVGQQEHIVSVGMVKLQNRRAVNGVVKTAHCGTAVGGQTLEGKRWWQVAWAAELLRGVRMSVLMAGRRLTDAMHQVL